MKKISLILPLLLSSVNLFADLGQPVNWVVIRVGTYSVTEYDVQRMEEFQKLGGNINADKQSAFQELVLIYALKTLANQSSNLNIQPGQTEKLIASITNMTNTADLQAKARLDLFNKYPDIFTLQMEKEQVMANLFFLEQELKNQSAETITPQQKTNYYEKHKKSFISPPKLDMFVFAVYKPTESLSEVGKIEKYMIQLKNDLAKTDDVEKIKQKYQSKLNFLNFSGRTGYSTVYELMQTGKYPEEILAIPLQKKLTLPSKTIKISEGKSFFIDQPIPVKNLEKPVYLVYKIIRRDQPRQMTYEEVDELIDIGRVLKEINKMDILIDYIIKKIGNSQIYLKLFDKRYTQMLKNFMDKNR